MVKGLKPANMKFCLLLSIGILVSYGCDETETLTPTAITAPIINITHSSATSGGEVTDNGGSTVSARGVCWDTSPSPTISQLTKTNDGTGTGSFISLMAGLTGNTTYHVRAYATNNNGTSYGEELLFNTGIGALDQEQTTENYGFAVGDNIERWQVFAPTLNNISTIELFMQTVTPTGSCTVKVQSEDGNITYTEQTFDASMLPEYDWFETGIISVPATPDTKYRISVSRSDTHSPDNAIYWKGNTDSSYPGYCDVNPDWEDYDYAFRTYGF